MARLVGWRRRILVALVVSWLFGGSLPVASPAEKPNVLYILCDDLGYGDVQAFNPEGKIPTPNMNRLAAEGMKFTDAHSGSAVCSPTRYGIMTGRYSWRSKLQSGVLGGLSPRLIEPGRLTVADLLKSAGYHTTCIGKWHLGMDWTVLPGKEISELSIETPEQVWNVDYSQPISNGPCSVGFDEYFGISASLDMVPYVFIHNDRPIETPTESKSFPMVLGRPKRQTRKGPATPDFEAVEVLPTLTRKTIDTIRARASDAQNGKPFFIYLPFASPHTPVVPAKEWRGKTGLTPYADFVAATDHSLGQILSALDQCGLADNTLVVLTSDNGFAPAAQMDELIAKGHHPSYHFRGHKADIYEGGHRIPFIVRWPGKVRAGSQCDQIVCLTDLMATLAEILEIELPAEAGVDSYSLLPYLREMPSDRLRPAIVHHSVRGAFAIREGNWKLALCPGSGGWSAPRPEQNDQDLPPVQLFDLSTDIGETINLQEAHPEIVARLTQLLEKYVADGRSTPGLPQENAVPVRIRK
ncbi:sulfatase family protein [Planctomicrobium sp. SH664]|uniref:sulfatase family protein n=1 Tax=Planctomicrobium sp. SH664 TaxID=3448125 RepID=UPI003F5C1D04